MVMVSVDDSSLLADLQSKWFVWSGTRQLIIIVVVILFYDKLTIATHYKT